MWMKAGRTNNDASVVAHSTYLDCVETPDSCYPYAIVNVVATHPQFNCQLFFYQ